MSGVYSTLGYTLPRVDRLCRYPSPFIDYTRPLNFSRSALCCVLSSNLFFSSRPLLPYSHTIPSHLHLHRPRTVAGLTPRKTAGARPPYITRPPSIMPLSLDFPPAFRSNIVPPVLIPFLFFPQSCERANPTHSLVCGLVRSPHTPSMVSSLRCKTGRLDCKRVICWPTRERLVQGIGFT